jgi:porin
MYSQPATDSADLRAALLTCRKSAGRWAVLVLAVIVLTLGTAPRVAAQAVNSGVGIGPSLQVAQLPTPAPTQALDAPQVERLFGAWNSPQTALWQHGFNLQVDALTEFASNVSGGTQRGSTFASQIGVQLDINWERLAQVTGLSTHLVIVNRSGSSDSALFGDYLSPVQEIYGSGGDVAIHLVSAYAQETLLNGQLDFAAGRMNVENDFASSPLYCNFMNNGLCGDPKALPAGDIGHSAYPEGVWGGRVRVRPVPTVYVQGGMYEVDQGLYSNANFRSGFKLDTSQDSGVYLPVELGWEPSFGANKLPGHYKFGFGYDSSPGFMNFSNAFATAGMARSHRGNTQLWLLADQMLFHHGPDAADGLTAMAGFIQNDPNNTALAEQFFAGLLDKGFWPSRPQDSIGLLLLHYTMSKQLNQVQNIEQASNLPFSNAATGVQSHETIIELNYDIHVFRGVNFAPDFQYVFQPNAQANIHNAAVLGFKTHVEF